METSHPGRVTVRRNVPFCRFSSESLRHIGRNRRRVTRASFTRHFKSGRGNPQRKTTSISAEAARGILTERFRDGHRAQDGHQRYDDQAGPQFGHAFEKRELLVFVLEIGERYPELGYARGYVTCGNTPGAVSSRFTTVSC